MPDLALVNAGELVTCSPTIPDEGGLGIIENGSLVVDGGKVTWIGTTREYNEKSFGKTRQVVDAKGCLVTPGFVDPHTHVVFAGSREDELERKVSGESYLSILESGGGIARTIRETRKAPMSKLVSESQNRVMQLMKKGVTTLEVKTGYGQSTLGEMKMLEAIDEMRGKVAVELVATLLGLHATPPRFSSPKEYVDYAIREILPRVSGMRKRPAFSDCFCEDGVFSKEECSRYLRASAELGFGLKVHADEFKESGGASLAAELGCVSADHLVASGEPAIDGMARKGVVAVLLPSTALNSGIPFAKAKEIMGSGCNVALGTDLSPNSWIESPQLVMSLACSAMKMTPAQALLGFTKNAAMAISRDDIGWLGPGASADFAIHKYDSYRFLPYRVGGDYVGMVFKKGKGVYTRTEG